MIGRGVLAVPTDHPTGLANRRIRELELLRAAQASALRCARAVITHFASAVALGIPTYRPPDRPCLTVQAGTALRELAGAHLHRATLRAEDVVEVGGYPVTRPARTVMDIAREFGAEAGVVAADYVLHEGLATDSELLDAYDFCRTWPGRKAARITLLSADGDAESPLESLSRLRIAAAHLPRPRLQREICDMHGQHLLRSDFLWDEYGVVGEADGNMKYRPDGRQADDEREKQELVEDAGLIVVRWGWRDLYAFGGVTRRLERGFARGERPGSPRRRWGLLLPR